MGTVHAKARGADADGANTEGSQRGRLLPSRLASTKARIDKININGLARTKNDVVEASIDDLFKATNYEEVFLRADNVRSKLDALECFSDIKVFVDVSRGPNASADGLEVTFHVEELRRAMGGINTTVGNNSGSLLIGMQTPNIAGRGEKIQVEYSKGLHKFSNFSLKFSKPYPYKRYEPIISLSLIQQIGEYPHSGYRQLDKGLLVDLAFRTMPRASHNLQWEGIFRDTSTLSKSTAFAVREHSGPAMKSAIRHILTVDNRDNRIFPTSGVLFQFISELSGLGGSMSFLKNELNFQTNVEIMEDVVIQGTAQTGLLNDFHKTNMTEHFFMGGPLNVRGFNMRGIGPQADGSALGSNFFWATGLHLFAPLPFRPKKGGIGDSFRTHFFLNAGNITPINNLNDVHNNIADMMKDVRLSAGVGLALNFANVARFELNYCFPLKYVESDVRAPGLQFGFGINFL